jgi:4-amino-4-deoxy-L-arabinose transferase-like glycosyltransferase
MGGAESDLNIREIHAEQKRKFLFPLRRKSSWLMLGILALAFFLRFYHLGNRPLYMDEIDNTVATAAKPMSFILSTNKGSILYALILHFLLPLGKTEFIARAPAAIFGVLSIWMIFLLGKTIFSRTESILAALLAATSTHFIYYSQQARGYSGLLLFFIGSLFFFLTSLKRGKPYDWVLYVVFTAVAVYMHFFALIVVAVQLFFFGVTLIGRKLWSKKTDGFVINKKTCLLFVLSLLSIAILVYFLYFPARNQPPNENLFYGRQPAGENLFLMLPRSIRGLLQGQLSLGPIPVVTEILKRQFDYDTSAVFFYIKLILVFFGVLAALMNERRELIFLLTCLILPIALFVLSNPPIAYLPVDNKFTFLLPILIFLMARGMTGASAFLARVLPKDLRPKNESPIAKGFLAFLIALVLFGEGIYLKGYDQTMWKLRSLDRRREVRSYLDGRVINEEALFTNTSEALLESLIIRPLFHAESNKKFLMVYESTDPRSRTMALSRVGLWVLLNGLNVDEKRVSQGTSYSGGMEIRTFAHDTLIHFSSPEMPLWEKLALAVDLIVNLPHRSEDEDAYRFFLAKNYLLAGKNQEARRELNAIQKRKIVLPKKGRHQEILQNVLLTNVFDLLLENAAQARLEGNEAEAISLWQSAENLGPLNAESQGAIIFTQAESFLKIGMANEARTKYLEALPFCQNPAEEDYVIEKIANLFNLPSGYLLWRQGGIWHLRWWGKQSSAFSGKIVSSPSSMKLKKYRLTEADAWTSSDGTMTFRGYGADGKIKGFDISAEVDAALSFFLRMDGRKNILDEIIIADKEEHPQSMPFSLK